MNRYKFGMILLAAFASGALVSFTGCNTPPPPAPQPVTRDTSAIEAYDQQLMNSITTHWHEVLEQNYFKKHLPQGAVVVRFRLQDLGTVSDLEVVKNDAGDFWGYVCQKTIMDLAPFPRWPTKMRESLDKRYRDIEFKFSFQP